MHVREVRSPFNSGVMERVHGAEAKLIILNYFTCGATDIRTLHGTVYAHQLSLSHDIESSCNSSRIYFGFHVSRSETGRNRSRFYYLLFITFCAKSNVRR